MPCLILEEHVQHYLACCCIRAPFAVPVSQVTALLAGYLRYTSLQCEQDTAQHG